MQCSLACTQWLTEHLSQCRPACSSLHAILEVHRLRYATPSCSHNTIGANWQSLILLVLPSLIRSKHIFPRLKSGSQDVYQDNKGKELCYCFLFISITQICISFLKLISNSKQTLLKFYNETYSHTIFIILYYT